MLDSLMMNGILVIELFKDCANAKAHIAVI